MLYTKPNDNNFYNYKGEVVGDVYGELDENWKQEVGF